MKTAGIAGAGLVGRQMALALARRGWSVTLFDADAPAGHASCARAAAGILGPFTELDHAEPLIAKLGVLSMPLWARLVDSLSPTVFFQAEGALAVAHPGDMEELRHLQRQVERKWPAGGVVEEVTGERLGELEPDLGPTFARGLYFAGEGQVDNRQLLPALHAAALEAGVAWRSGARVSSVKPRVLELEGESLAFDWVFDCRGLGARPDLASLRGVRGELVHVAAPEVALRRPVRLMHPRYPIYIVPRPDNVYIIGASSIESEDFSPVSVRSLLELLSALYSLHPGFAEARVLETVVNCRPALLDNLPRIFYDDGLMRINGLYRHGYLVSPAVVQFALDFLETGEPEPAEIFSPDPP